MNFIISANTDVGIVKETNQDSLSVMVVNTCQGRMAFAVLCDGMGGLSLGEVASSSVTNAFRSWVMRRLPVLCSKPLDDKVIRDEWIGIVRQQNDSIRRFGAEKGVRLGTTVVAMLLTQDRYYILNVGDSRAYEIGRVMRQITNDQSLVAREVALGNLTPEEAERDPRRNVLLQCVGALDMVYPDVFCGEICTDGVYMLCSDGFRHEISQAELFDKLRPEALLDEHMMHAAGQFLVELNKQRREQDNISVALIRTF